jgi:3-dehydrosphinganine reductase
MAPHALISGGSSGIGLAFARRLAAGGWNVTILARGKVRLGTARTAIEAVRTRAEQAVLAVVADVADPDQVTDAVNHAVKTLGPISLLVTSAGMVIPGLFDELPLSAFRETMNVNYLGTVNMVRATLPAMRGVKDSRIVLISSGAGLVGLYGYSAYAPSKFAVRAFAEVLRSELAPEGIGVSVVYPPDTDTPQLHEEIKTRPAALAHIAAGSKVKSPDDIAAAMLSGIRRGRFTIAPGWEMGMLARLHSLIGPLLHRFWFDPVVAKWHRRGAAQSP